MIGILRYSAGNSGSVQRALQRLAIPHCFVDAPAQLENLDGLIFPGVGAAPVAMTGLQRMGFVEPLKKYPKPFLGLCLGMQLLFDRSEEGDAPGLGIISGVVRELPPTVTRPHMGWNKLSTGDYAYFVHGYYCAPADRAAVTMTTRYGTDICAGVRRKNFFGVQWHPEKSARVGDQLFRAFANLCK